MDFSVDLGRPINGTVFHFPNNTRQFCGETLKTAIELNYSLLF